MIKISSSTLPYLMAKAHANRSRSPNHYDISSMLSAPSIVEVETILQRTSYGKILDVVRPSVDLTQFEKEMRMEYANLIHLYKKAASKDLEALLDAYSIVIDAENFTIIMLNILQGNKNRDDLENVIIPVGKYGYEHYRRMMNAATVEIASDFIPYPIVRKAVQQALAISDDPNDQVFHLSAALSHSSFAILRNLAPNWIKHEVELLNLETLCRAVNLGIDANIWMIPNSGVVSRLQKTLSSMKTPREIISYILPQFPAPGPLKQALQADDENIVAVLEDAALVHLHARHKAKFYMAQGKESILDFLSLKKAELEDIARILFSKQKNIPSEEIRGMLYPIYKR